MIKFSPLNRKKVEANFEGGSITSNGVLLLLRETDKRLKLTSRISSCISDNRKSCLIHHDIKTLLRQRVYGISVGDEDTNDQDKLRNDICFQTCVNQESTLASSSTISRFENSIDRETLKQMSIEMVESFIDNQQTAPEELILDFDPTDNIIYGNQENRHYHGYYKNHCYLPLHVFCGDQLVVSMLRSSDIDGAKYAGAILKLLVERFRKAWNDVKIVFRGDCAFARRHILHWCERHKVDYVVGMPSNVRLQALAKTLVEKAEDKFNATGEKQKLFSHFNYAAQTWKTERRIIVKAEHNFNGANTRFVLTSLPESSEIIYTKRYCKRGDMENHIKQLKLDLHSDRNSCSNFYANYFRLLLSSLAYILITELKNTHLKATKLAKSYCGILQLKLFKIGAVVIKNSRRVKFLLSSAYTMQKDFISAVQSLVPS